MRFVDCTIQHLMAYAERAEPAFMHAYPAVAAQMHASFSVAGLNGMAEVVTLAGLYAHGDGRPIEAWFIADTRAAAHMVGVCRGLRRELRRGACGAPMICRIRSGHRPGEVIARSLGFTATGVVKDGAQIWRKAREGR